MHKRRIVYQFKKSISCILFVYSNNSKACVWKNIMPTVFGLNGFKLFSVGICGKYYGCMRIWISDIFR